MSIDAEGYVFMHFHVMKCVCYGVTRAECDGTEVCMLTHVHTYI